MIELRPERPADRPAIHDVEARAFGGPAEADLVDVLRERGELVVSLVAVGSERHELIGHVGFSPVRVDGAGAVPGLVGLAPLAVVPERQRQGVGAALVRRGLDVLREQGYRACVVLGHASYYPRFGFRPAAGFGLRFPGARSQDSFFALELVPGALDGVAGEVRYAPPFEAVGRDASRMPDPIYLDHNATTPVDPEVFEAMRPYFLEDYGNAASRQHVLGRRAADAVERARDRVATALGADPREIVWTSGATESNNLALKGVAHAPAYAGRRHLVTVATEHSAVLDPCAALAEEGLEVTRLGVGPDGLVDVERVGEALREDTLLVSVMLANNETGVLQPVREIGALCAPRGVLLHTDATQAVGREPVDVGELGVHLLSLSAHKVYGPKGVGALYVRRKGPRVRLRASIDGGGHERGMRSGTLAVPSIVGLGAAMELAERVRAEEAERVGGLRDRLEEGLASRLDGVFVHGAGARRLANTTNVSFTGVDAESLLARVPEVCASSSAACTSARFQRSHVLAAMGLSDDEVEGSVRFSLGRRTTAEQVDRAIETITDAVERERVEGPRSACG